MSIGKPEKVAALATAVKLWWEQQSAADRRMEYQMKDLTTRFGCGDNIMGQALRTAGWQRTRATGKAGGELRVWAPPGLPADEQLIQLRTILKRGALPVDALADKLRVTRGRVHDLCDELRRGGYLVHAFGDHYEIGKAPGPSPTTEAHVLTTDRAGYIKLGYTSDNHLCSKYAREDVLSDLYDWFAGEGVGTVLNTGNWIDGEARFNKHDIFVHGMEPQIDYFVERYPQRKGVETRFVSGDDHEGWYGQREGIDIGAFAESKARSAGRKDLTHLGFVESFVTLQSGATGESTQLLVAHPGGGSAYATSYAPQKYVEALQGGEKPGAVFFGHWHKIFDLYIRDVVCLGGGCTKDLDPFGRKNKLAYHLGGMIVEFWLDERGAISRWRVETKRYFDRGYYNGQWSYSGRPAIDRRAA